MSLKTVFAVAALALGASDTTLAQAAPETTARPTPTARMAAPETRARPTPAARMAAPETRARPTPKARIQRSSAAPSGFQIKDKINAWTVGLAGGLLEGAPIRFATEIARVVDDGENLHVLPIVTRGPSENLESLLYLRGVDAAIINSDSLEQFKTIVPEIQNRISYILNLFPSEVHILAGPGINSLDDLKGKRVNFNTPGTAAAYSGPLIFEKLNIEVEKGFIPHPRAMEQMANGEVAAVVFVTSKPIDLLKRQWAQGFKLLPVPFDPFVELYLPTSLTSADYPGLVPDGKDIPTVAIPTILAAFNWPKNSERYQRVARLTSHLFSRIDQLKQPGFHPKWMDVNIHAGVPGLERFAAAQEILNRDNSAASAPAPADPVRERQVRQMVRSAAPNSRAEQERLFREFMEWRRANNARRVQ